MAGSTLGTIFKISTWGESHGKALGVVIDDEANNGLRGRFGVITKPESKITVCVIPTDEEVMIARDCVRLLGC